jgi:hypothetical protein
MSAGLYTLDMMVSDLFFGQKYQLTGCDDHRNVNLLWTYYIWI